MKKRLLSIILPIMFLFVSSMYGQVSITNGGALVDPDPSSILDLSNSSKGLLLPRVANTGAVSSPQAGMMVFSTADNCVMYYSGTQWVSLCDCLTPVITTPATALTVSAVVNQSVTLSVTASNTYLPTYQWYKGAVGVTTTPVGTNSASYTYIPTVVGTETYWCRVTNGCGASSRADSPLFTVSVLAQGSGTFTGKLCFDINKSNWNSDCGTQDMRNTQMVDFATLDSVSYTFKASNTGVKSNLRFIIEDSEGCVSGTNGITVPGPLANGQTVVLKVKYNNTLSLETSTPKIVGRDKQAAATVKIYAVYTVGGVDNIVPLTVKIQDCICCGAATVGGGWLAFMCHNLGADNTLDPFTWSGTVEPNIITGTDDGIKGWLYQWGRPTDGHQRRNLTSGTGIVAGIQATNDRALAPASVVGKFIRSDSGFNDWYNGTSNARWGDGTTNENQAKGFNDPCPTGWKVPSQKQWASIFGGATSTASTATANTWVWTGNGVMVGQSLYLPAAGIRTSTADIQRTGIFGLYWASTISSSGNSCGMEFISNTPGTTLDIYPMYTQARACGISIRCVAE